MYKISTEDLANHAYKNLRQMILKGDLKPGERLRQEALAEVFGVSRTPILQAISKLEKEMLVQITPRRGAFVRQYSTEELVQIYEIRLRLETLGARQAAESASAAEKTAIRKLEQNFEKCLQSPQEGSLRMADFELHTKIIETSKNSFLISYLSVFSIIVLANTRGLLKDPHDSMADHQRILAAIEANDGNAAEQTMHDHIFSAMAALKKTP